MTDIAHVLESGSSTVKPMPYWLSPDDSGAHTKEQAIWSVSSSREGHVLDALAALAGVRYGNRIKFYFTNNTLSNDEDFISLVLPTRKFSRKITVRFGGEGKFLID